MQLKDIINEFKNIGLSFVRVRSLLVPRWEGKPLADENEWRRFAETAHVLAENGISVSIVLCDQNLSVFESLPESTVRPFVEKFGEYGAMSALVSAGIGLGDERVIEALLSDIKTYKDLFPESTIGELYNGNETKFWEPWNLLRKDFKEFAVQAGVGTMLEEFDIRNNYRKFEEKAEIIWNDSDNFFKESTHVYGTLHDTKNFWAVGNPESFYISELGAKIVEGGTELSAHRLMRFWSHVLDQTLATNVSFFEAVSPQFFNLFEEGKTSLLWSEDGMSLIDDTERKLPGVYTLFPFEETRWAMRQVVKAYPIDFGIEVPWYALPKE